MKLNEITLENNESSFTKIPNEFLNVSNLDNFGIVKSDNDTISIENGVIKTNPNLKTIIDVTTENRNLIEQNTQKIQYNTDNIQQNLSSIQSLWSSLGSVSDVANAAYSLAQSGGTFSYPNFQYVIRGKGNGVGGYIDCTHDGDFSSSNSGTWSSNIPRLNPSSSKYAPYVYGSGRFLVVMFILRPGELIWPDSNSSMKPLRFYAGVLNGGSRIPPNTRSYDFMWFGVKIG